MINKQTRTKVSNLMRRDLKKTNMANNARKRAFKGKTVYHCVVCDVHYYTGASEKNFIKLKEETYPDLVRYKEKDFHLDHIDPVVPIGVEFHSMTLDEIAVRVYCNEDNISYICKECHTVKTSKEKTKRSKK